MSNATPFGEPPHGGSSGGGDWNVWPVEPLHLSASKTVLPGGENARHDSNATSDGGKGFSGKKTTLCGFEAKVTHEEWSNRSTRTRLRRTGSHRSSRFVSVSKHAATLTAIHARTEHHRQDKLGWLRAAVLGANDGLISTASLLIGVAAADASRNALVQTGFAALGAGALSMAAGEYVSVSAQADAEAADIAKESKEIEDHEESEIHELAAIYRGRGLNHDLANQVARAMHEHDALGAHLRDELSITETSRARPVQAAVYSAAAFAIGAVVALLAALVAPNASRIAVIAISTLVALGSLGVLGARLGGAPVGRAAARVLLGGALAMAVTALIGRLVGQAI
jgi:vacuolar iron transporter family protein